MAWTEAPASGESRRSTVIPHAFRHRVSSRLYLCGRSERRRFIPLAAVGRCGVVRPAWAIDAVRFRRPTGRFFHPTNSRARPQAVIGQRSEPSATSANWSRPVPTSSGDHLMRCGITKKKAGAEPFLPRRSVLLALKVRALSPDRFLRVSWQSACACIGLPVACPMLPAPDVI